MPEVSAYSNEKDWMGACVPRMMDEGRDQDQAVAACMSMWSNKFAFGDMSLDEAVKYFLKQQASAKHGGAHAGHGGMHAEPTGGEGGEEDGGGSGGDGSSEGGGGRAKLHEVEKSLIGKSEENAVVMDADGNIIKEISGGHAEAGLDSDTMKSLKDNILTHNHPNNTSLSPEDLNKFVTTDAAEFRAISSDGKSVFVVTKPEEGWGKPAKRIEIANRVRNNANAFLQREAGRAGGTITGDKLAQATYRMNEAMADKFGWTYKVESIAGKSAGGYIAMKAMMEEMMMSIEEMGMSRCRAMLQKLGKDPEGMTLDEMRAMLKRMASGEQHDQIMTMVNGSMKYFSTLMNATQIPMIAVKAVGDWELDVVPVPFGSSDNRDSDKQWFDPSTEIMEDAYPTPLVIYQHGIQQGAKEYQGKLITVGKSVPGTLRKMVDGWHVRVILDKTVAVAKQIMEAARKGLVAVSSDSIAHLARLDIGGKLIPYEKDRPGRIAIWPLAGFSLWEIGNGNFKPANRQAIALPVFKAMYRDAGVPFPDVSLSSTDGALPEADEAVKRAWREEIEKAKNYIKKINRILGD